MKKIERIEKGQQYELNNETKKMVSEELLKMGFSYSWIGTYYVQDMIVLAMDTPTGEMETVKELKGLLNKKNCGTLRNLSAQSEYCGFLCGGACVSLWKHQLSSGSVSERL